MSFSTLRSHSPVCQDVQSSPKDTKSDLYDHAEALLKYIDLDVLVPCLRRERLLTDDEVYTVRNPYLPPGTRIQNLLTFVTRKGPDGPEIFVQCIARTAKESRGHTHLVEKVLGFRPEQEVNADIAGHVSSIQENKKKVMMRDKFAFLLTKASAELKNIDMKDFKVYVSNLPSSEKSPDDSIALSDKEKIQKANTPDEIFHVLTNSNYWGYREPFLLYLIVGRFGSVDLVNEVAKYREQLEPFESDSSFMPKKSPPEAQKFAKNPVLSQKFANVVINLQKSFEELDVLDRLKVFATLLPMEYGQMEQRHSDAIASASDVSSIFGILGYYWNWQRFRPLKCIVETLGTPEVQKMVTQYDKEFRSRVPQQQPCHYETPAIETELFSYRIQFAQLVLKVLIHFEESDITLDAFHKFLASRQSAYDQNRHIAILEPAFNAAKSWSDIFLVLNHTWDHFNFELLHEVLENFQIQELLPQFFRYQDDIHRFIDITPLSVLVQALPSRHPLARKGFVKLSISFDPTDTEHNLVHFAQFRQSLAKEFDIPEYAIKIHTIKFRSVLIGTKKQFRYRLKCYILSSVAGLLIVESRAKGHFYEEHQITHLKFHEDKQYYFSCSILESGYLRILQQAKANPDVYRRLKELGADLEDVAELSFVQRLWAYFIHQLNRISW